MSLFFRLFNVSIPIHVLIIVASLTLVASCMTYIFCKEKRKYHILQIWIAADMLLMLYSTVVGRSSQPEISIHLIPFWSIGAIQDGYVETLYEKIYNLLFFMPLGCLFGVFFKYKILSRSMIAGLTVSIVIEMLQLITRTGTCETDDVICNTLGCLIGASIVCGAGLIVRQIKER